MPVLSVGQPYIAGRTNWPEAAEYNYSVEGHELRLFFPAPTPQEVEDVRKGDAEFALYTAGPVVWLLHRFGRGNWADSPFAWHLVPEDRRARPWEAQELERATITVLLVEAASGILQAIRLLTFSPHFTRQLHAAIERQAEAPWDPAEFDRVLDATYARLSTAEMVRGAVAKTRGGH